MAREEDDTAGMYAKVAEILLTGESPDAITEYLVKEGIAAEAAKRAVSDTCAHFPDIRKRLDAGEERESVLEDVIGSGVCAAGALELVEFAEYRMFMDNLTGVVSALEDDGKGAEDIIAFFVSRGIPEDDARAAYESAFYEMHIAPMINMARMMLKAGSTPDAILDTLRGAGYDDMLSGKILEWARGRPGIG